MTTQYDWCFGGPGGPYLVFEWWADLLEEDGVIYFVDTSSEWAEKNGGTALQVQLNRASAVTSLVLQAYYTKAPIYVALLDGVHRVVDGRETSEAHLRELDSEKWYPHHKDADGRIVVLRGQPQSDEFDPWADDQLRANERGVPPPPTAKRVELTRTTIYPRDSEVVKAVKRRAEDGCCELCKKEGFRTPQGGFYLEAHHVIPLSCGGADKPWNVVAICPDDHRRAHFGLDRNELRDRLIWDVIARHYGEGELLLEDLDKKSAEITRNDGAQQKLEADAKVGA